MVSPRLYAENEPMNGPYIGIGRSVVAIHEDYNQSTPSSTSVLPNTSINIDDTFWADNINLIAGMGKKTKSNYYYGGEITSNIYFYSNRTLKNTTLTYIYDVTASALLGHYIGNNMLVYTRLGIVMSNLDIKYTGQTTPNSTEQLGNGTARALNMGIGASYLLYQHLSVRGEFNYLSYQKLNVALYPENYTANLRLTGQQIEIGILYTF